MTITNTNHFDIQRKIVANMTTESWHDVPHVTFNYEPEVSKFLDRLRFINSFCREDKKITLNTAMLKVITEGLKAAPIMNSHIKFNKKLVRGKIMTFEDINISMPMLLPDGSMMTVNLHNFEDKNIWEMSEYIADIRRKIKNTDLNEVMVDVSMANTFDGLRKGKLKQTVYRIIGSKTGRHRIHSLSGKDKKNYYAVSEDDRLTKHDIEQGTITVSNIGSLYRNQSGATCLLEIVPPQVCAISIGAVQEKPIVTESFNGKKEVKVGKVMPICIAFDHRALDFGDIVPFLKRLDDVFQSPECI